MLPHNIPISKPINPKQMPVDSNITLTVESKGTGAKLFVSTGVMETVGLGSMLCSALCRSQSSHS